MDLLNASLSVSTCSRGRGGLVCTLECYITKVTCHLLCQSCRRHKRCGRIPGTKPTKTRGSTKPLATMASQLQVSPRSDTSNPSSLSLKFDQKFILQQLLILIRVSPLCFCVLTDLLGCSTRSPQFCTESKTSHQFSHCSLYLFIFV